MNDKECDRRSVICMDLVVFLAAGCYSLGRLRRRADRPAEHQEAYGGDPTSGHANSRARPAHTHRGRLSSQKRHRGKERNRDTDSNHLAIGGYPCEFGAVEDTVGQAKQDRQADNKGKGKRTVSRKQGAKANSEDDLRLRQCELRGEPYAGSAADQPGNWQCEENRSTKAWTA